MTPATAITSKDSGSSSLDCPFCTLRQANSDRILQSSNQAFVIRDAYPVSPGHTLIIPTRHFASFFDCTPEEQAELLHLLRQEKQRLDEEFSPIAYNIGINDGPGAGQTVAHLHVHLIPRYEGDVADPRGGIRWLFPDKANYWDKNP